MWGQRILESSDFSMQYISEVSSNGRRRRCQRFISRNSQNHAANYGGNVAEVLDSGKTVETLQIAQVSLSQNVSTIQSCVRSLNAGNVSEFEELSSVRQTPFREMQQVIKQPRMVRTRKSNWKMEKRIPKMKISS